MRQLLRARSLGAVSGQVSWLPGHGLAPDLPRLAPVGGIAEWRRALAPEGSGLAGYSGGTAQAFDLLPYYPPDREAP